MTAESESELKENIRLACESAALDTSPTRILQIHGHIGFYTGYVAAKDWQADYAFIMDMVRLIDPNTESL